MQGRVKEGKTNLDKILCCGISIQSLVLLGNSPFLRVTASAKPSPVRSFSPSLPRCPESPRTWISSFSGQFPAAAPRTICLAQKSPSHILALIRNKSIFPGCASSCFSTAPLINPFGRASLDLVQVKPECWEGIFTSG